MGQGIDIYTLGGFQVKNQEGCLTKNIRKTSKRWKLLQYLITHHKRKVSREELIMVLDLDNSDDPESALNALVYRLRKLLNCNCAGSAGSEPDYIKTVSSAYTFNTEADYWLDAEEFKDLCQETWDLLQQESEQAPVLFEHALSLYEGDYLQEYNSEEWLWSARHHYREILLKTMDKFAGYLNEKEEYEQLLYFYDQVNQRIPFDENMLKGKLTTLLAAGEITRAKKQYDEVVDLYQENDLLVPPDIRSIAEKFRSERGDFPYQAMDEAEENGANQGAFVTGPENFIKLYELEKRRVQRDDHPRVVVHIRLTEKEPIRDMQSLGDNFLQVASAQLRSGDIVCRWNKKHFIILLADIQLQDALLIIERLEKAFILRYSKPAGVSFEERSYQLE